MIIVLQVDAPLHMAQGIKETLAMQLERFGDTKVIEIRDDKPKKEVQTKLW
jgi:kynurenine formamidase